MINLPHLYFSLFELHLYLFICSTLGGTSGKESACQRRDVTSAGLIPGLGRCPGGGNGNPFQYSCLENPMDRGTWWVIVHGVAKSQKQLSI